MTIAHCDLAIIGGGPAGLSAAVTAANAHLDFVLIAPNIGGKTSYGFSLKDVTAPDNNWELEAVAQLEKRFREFPARYIPEKISAVERESNGLFRLTKVGPQGVEQTLRATTVIVASGVEPVRLYITGEKKYWGRGVSYSMTSHVGTVQERNVAVIGYGTRVVVAALQLATIANHVYLFPTVRLPETDKRTEQVQSNQNITIMEGWEPMKFVGNEFLDKIAITRDRQIREIDIEAAFIELGLLPEKEFLRGLLEVDPENGQIPINHLCETEVAGLFAAGDVTNTTAEQVAVAIGEGMKSALSAWRYLAHLPQQEYAIANSAGLMQNAG